MALETWHILIVNQHGENRGDEAAMRAMVNAFVERLGNVRFTILHQFRNRDLRPALDAPVEWYPLVLSPFEAAHLALLALGRRIGLRLPLGRGTASRICAAYDSADLVVSAPGGPYFGDIYANHELVHWYFVFLGKLFSRPMVLYATSAGPFRSRFLNPVRRWLFPTFDVVCVREEVSAGFLHELLPALQVRVTADSALQRPPSPRATPVVGLNNPLLVAVSVREQVFPDSTNTAALKRRQAYYLDVLKAAILHIAKRRPAKFLLFPQLYGGSHCDVEFLRSFAADLPREIEHELVDPNADADEQQCLIATADLCIASRYHPQIFAAAAGIPGICISYEHKMVGFMRQLGLERFTFPVETLDKQAILEALDELLENLEAISEQLLRETARLRKDAARTTELAVELLDPH